MKIKIKIETKPKRKSVKYMIWLTELDEEEIVLINNIIDSNDHKTIGDLLALLTKIIMESELA